MLRPTDGPEHVCLSADVSGRTYVNVSIPEAADRVSMLVDTGSTLTIMRNDLFRQLPFNFDVAPTHIKVKSVNGAFLSVYGCVSLPISIGSLSVRHNVILADIEPDMLLGQDVLRAHGIIVDYRHDCLLVGNSRIPFCDSYPFILHAVSKPTLDSKVAPPYSCRVRLCRAVTVPGYSQVISPAMVEVPGTQAPSNPIAGIIEPTEEFLQRFCIGAANIVTVVNEENTVPMRLQNLLPDPITINANTIVAEFTNAVTVEEPVPESTTTDTVYCSAVSESASVADLFDLDHLSVDEKEAVSALLNEFSDVVSTGPLDVGTTTVVQHDIRVTCPGPLHQTPRRLPMHQQSEVREHVDQLLDAGKISPSNSPWAAPIVVVRKPDSSIRLCVDYRRLNKVTIKDAYPLPRVEDTIDAMAGASYFSTFDLASGFWQVELTNAAKSKSAFVTPFGLYQWNVMPFGLCNAPATFIPSTCNAFMDDVITFAQSFANQLHNMRSVLIRFRDAGLKIKPKKCKLMCKEVSYLGHVFSASGVAPDPAKFSVIKTWPTPRSATDVRRFVGLASYYRRFIPKFAEIADPLHGLTKKKVPFSWTGECQAAFEKLQDYLVTAPILQYPDPSLPFVLDTDASNVGIGAVLSQICNGQERVIGYASRSLSKSQRKYGTPRKEMFAVVHFTNHFRHYLLGAPFILRTDHRSLIWLDSFRDTDGLLARWLEKLSAFQYSVLHRPGSSHGNADALSRLPELSQFFVTSDDTPTSDDVAAAVSSSEHSVSDGSGALEIPSTPATTQGPDVSTEQPPPEPWSGFWSREELRTAQEEDPDITKMIGWQQALLDRPKRHDIAMNGATPGFLRLWGQWKRLRLVDGVLYRTYTPPDGSEDPFLQLLIPASLRPVVLKSLHSDCSGGHLGAEKTLEKIRRRFYWPLMTADVKHYCQSCADCEARNSAAPIPRAPLQTVRPSYPLERVAMDIMGPLPTTARGNRYIVVIEDYFTKWVEAFPMADMRAETVAVALVDGFICRYGVPHTLHTDQGSQFESRLFQEMCRLLDMKKTRTTPYHPSGDGLVERMNRTLEGMLSSRVSDAHTDWDLYLQRSLFAYRCSVHSSTKETPSLLMFGRELSLPIDIMFNDSLQGLSTTVHSYIDTLRTTLQRAFTHAREAGAHAQRRQKAFYDRRTVDRKFAPGDAVLLHNPVVKPGTTKKFRRPWVGPYRIVDAIDDVVYRIEDHRGKRSVVHIDRLKKSHQQLPDTALQDTPPVSRFPVNPVQSPPQPYDPTLSFAFGGPAPVHVQQANPHGYALRNRNNLNPPVRYR